MFSDARSAALSALARFQVTDLTVGETLHRIAEITLDAMPSAAIAGMTVLGDDARPTTAVYTDEESPEIDEAQYREGKGPCLDAWRQNRVVRLDRVEDHASRYPQFSRACLEHGVMSTLSLPMGTENMALGAMNLYSRVHDGFTEQDETLGLDLSAAAASVLANVSAYWTAFELSQQLTQAMESRSVIEQAKGMLMARSPDLTPDQAFDVLRRASQRENVKLRTIAQRIVERRRDPSGGEDGRAE